MARQAGKKQAPAKIEEDDDDNWEDAVVDADDKETGQNLRLRDWRDVERFREMKELRRLVDDDYGLEEIFHIPLKPRAEPGIPAPHTAGKPAKGGIAARPAAKAAAPAPAKAQPPGKGHKTNSHAPAPAKAAVPAKAPAAAKTHAPAKATAAAKKSPAKPAPSSARARTEGLKAKAKRK
jgi:hypothetical protein